MFYLHKLVFCTFPIIFLILPSINHFLIELSEKKTAYKFLLRLPLLSFSRYDVSTSSNTGISHCIPVPQELEYLRPCFSNHPWLTNITIFVIAFRFSKFHFPLLDIRNAYNYFARFLNIGTNTYNLLFFWELIKQGLAYIIIRSS